MGHPLRAAILAGLVEFTSQNAKEIAARIGAPVRSVRYQLSRLAAEGLIDVSGSRRRRGVIEKLYRIRIGRCLDSVAHELMGPGESHRVVTETFRSMVADVTRALADASFERTESCEAWIALDVDEAGWTEIAGIASGAFDAVEAARSRAADRLARGEDAAAYGVSTLLWFERPRPEDRGSRSAVTEAAAGLRRAALGVGAAARERRPERVPVATLAAAMGHPVRMRILAALSRAEPLGVARIARHIREPPRRVRHHLGRLVADGLVARSPGTGRTRNLYSLLATPLLDEDDLARLGPGESRPVWAEVFRCVVNDVVAAISAGSFYRRLDFMQVRVPAALDAQGRAEIQAISREAVGWIEAAGTEAQGRLARSGAPPISATAGILWFELPEP